MSTPPAIRCSGWALAEILFVIALISADGIALRVPEAVTITSQLDAGDNLTTPASQTPFDDGGAHFPTTPSLGDGGDASWGDDVSQPPAPRPQDDVSPCPEPCVEAACHVACPLVPRDEEEEEGSNGSLSTTSPAEPLSPGVNLIDTGTVDQAQFLEIDAALSYVMLPLSAAGAVVNIFTVAVYLHPDMRSASSTYLAALTLAETLYLLLVPITVVPGLLWGSRATHTLLYLAAGIYLSNFVLISLRRLAFTLTFVVSFERFLAVAFPLKYKQLRFSGHPARIAFVVAAVVVLLHLHVAFKYEIVPVVGGSAGQGEEGEQHYTIRMRPFYQEHFDVFGNLANACRVLFAYVPLLGTLLLNVLTTVFLRRHRRTARSLTSSKDVARSDKAEVQTTVAILASTFVFVLFSLPTNVQTLFQNYHPTYSWMKREHYLFLVMNRVFGNFEVLSNIFDFMVYLILSRRFRLTFRKLYCRMCCPPKEKINDSIGMSSMVYGKSGLTQVSGCPH